MSLTNEMLKNLDRRRLDGEDSQSLIEDLEPAVHRSILSKYIIYLLLLILIIAGVVEIFYFNLSHLERQTKNPTTITHITPLASTEKLLANNTNKASMQAPTINAGPLPMPTDALVKTEVKESVEDKVNNDYQEAVAMIQQHQTEQAIQKLQGILQAFPEFQKARITLGTLYLEQNSLSDAKNLLAEGTKLFPQDVEMVSLYARALIANSEYKEALQALLSISNVAQSNDDYLELLASTYQSLGQSSQAVDIYQKLLITHPNDGRLLVGLGVAYQQEGKNNDAKEAFIKAKNDRELPLELQNFIATQLHD